VAVEARGDAGLARALREMFHTVITDLKMPDLDGLEVVRQLHAACGSDQNNSICTSGLSWAD
jgi:CheY-like chemotaxis protein